LKAVAGERRDDRCAAGVDVLLAAAADRRDTGQAAEYLLVAAATDGRADRCAEEDNLVAAAEDLGIDRGGAGVNYVFNIADNARDTGKTLENSVGVQRGVQGGAAGGDRLRIDWVAEDDCSLSGSAGEYRLKAARLNGAAAIETVDSHVDGATTRNRRADRSATAGDVDDTAVDRADDGATGRYIESTTEIDDNAGTCLAR